MNVNGKKEISHDDRRLPPCMEILYFDITILSEISGSAWLAFSLRRPSRWMQALTRGYSIHCC